MIERSESLLLKCNLFMLKKQITHFYIFILIVLMIVTMQPIPLLADTAIIDADDLLVRSGPGTSYEPIGHVEIGEQYTIVDSDSPWLKINYNEASGWVHEDYVVLSDESVTDASDDDLIKNDEDKDDSNSHDDKSEDSNLTIKKVFPYDTRTSLQAIHIREEASITSDILDVLTKNTSVTVLDEKDEWYEVEVNGDMGFIKKQVLDLTVNTPVGQSPLLDKTIVIDPGHGGVDVGAISLNDEYESHFAMQTGRALERHLSRQGAHVVFTRDDDYYYSLTSRATLSNYVKADMFLSLHYNSEPAYPTANGINTYYREPHFEELAENVHATILKETGANDRGVATGNYSVLRSNRRPGLLLELGFLSNAKEEQNIKTARYHEKLAKGITSGVIDYFENR